MRQDLEEWLKGNSEKIKKLEASGKYSGLPVVRLAASSKASFRSAPEDSTELRTSGNSPTPEGKPTADSDNLPGLRQEEVLPPALREKGPVFSSSPSSSPSLEPAEPPLTPSEEVFRPRPDKPASPPAQEDREESSTGSSLHRGGTYVSEARGKKGRSEPSDESRDRYPL